jgi:hypothetical protein
MDGDLEDIEELNSMRQIKELFTQMRNFYRKYEFEAKNIQLKGESLRQGMPQVEKELERRKTMAAHAGVGDLEEIGEFGLGLAPRLAKPVNKIEISKEREEVINKMQIDDD